LDPTGIFKIGPHFFSRTDRVLEPPQQGANRSDSAIPALPRREDWDSAERILPPHEAVSQEESPSVILSPLAKAKLPFGPKNPDRVPGKTGGPYLKVNINLHPRPHPDGKTAATVVLVPCLCWSMHRSEQEF